MGQFEFRAQCGYSQNQRNRGRLSLARFCRAPEADHLLEMTKREPMDEMYRWTRWAAPGGRGHGISGWVAIVVGAVAAIWTFHSVTRWWLALVAAALAWLVGTGLVGAIWALVRRIIEKREGI